jgi:hypothetical protein
MILYHFTSRAASSSILRTGLSRGSVPLAPGKDLNAAWLTSDGGPIGHGLECGGAFMTEEQRQQAYEWSGVLPPEGARFPKDSSVRLTVEIADDDENLHRWLVWARLRLPAGMIPVLHPVGSNSLRQAKSWFIYTGLIPPQAIVSVDEEPRRTAA